MRKKSLGQLAALIFFFPSFEKESLENEFDSLKDIINFSQTIRTENIPRIIATLIPFFSFF